MKINSATRAQITASDARFSSWLTANAGSGKTKVLIDRVARLLLDGVQPEQILCLTYTKSAAAEMKNRLFDRLGKWAMLADQELNFSLREMGIQTQLGIEELKKARTLFARAIEAPGGLKIQTIHAFCSSLLRKFPLEAGISPQFGELTERGQRDLYLKVLEILSTDEATEESFEHFSKIANVSNWEETVSKIVSKRNIFSKSKSRSEIYEAFSVSSEVSIEDDISSHFQNGTMSFLKKISDCLQKSTSTIDQKISKELSKISSIDLTSLQLLEKIFLYGKTAKAPFTAKLGKFSTKEMRNGFLADYTDEIDDFMVRLETFRNRRLSYLAAETSFSIHKFASAFLKVYTEQKNFKGLLDFDDLINITVNLLTTSAVADWVLYRLDGGIDHILVDEAQDTSPSQWNVIETLAQELTSGKGIKENRSRTVFVVGDQKQSIYSFQGADPGQFDRVRDSFSAKLEGAEKTLQVASLDYSFRSSQTILTLVDKIYEDARGEGFGWGRKHLAFKSELPGRIDLWPIIPKKVNPNLSKWEEPIELISDADHFVSLARLIAQEIKRMIDQDVQVPEQKTINQQPTFRSVRAGDFLILVQRRSEIFHEIIRACKDANLPIAGADRLRLAGELAIKDICNFLSFIDNADDDFSLAAILKSPLFGWNEKRLFELAHSREEMTLWQALRNDPTKFAKELEVFEDLRSVADFVRPYELIERILILHNGRSLLIGRLGKEAEEGIDTLLTQAMDYESSEIPSLTGFLAWISDENIEVKRQFDSSVNQIRVMTVHGAKGLEAPIVILPETHDFKNEISDEILFTDDLAFKKFSSTERSNKTTEVYNSQKQKNSAERDRLLYVALTRSEVWLIVAAAGNVSDDGKSWYKEVEKGLINLDAKSENFSHGHGLRYQRGEWLVGKCSAKHLKKDAKIKLPQIFKENLGTPVKFEKFINPSNLMGSKSIQRIDKVTESDGAKLFGTIVHLLLEKLPKSNSNDWQNIVPNLLKWAEINVSEETQIRAYKQAENILKKPSFEFIFAPDTLAEVQFSTILESVGGIPIVGVIDRLVLSQDSALIIDFKTNQEVPSSIDEVPLGILKQMGAYAASMQKVFPKKNIELGIIWTHSAELMKIDVNRAVSSIGSIRMT